MISIFFLFPSLPLFIFSTLPYLFRFLRFFLITFFIKTKKTSVPLYAVISLPFSLSIPATQMHLHYLFPFFLAFFFHFFTFYILIFFFSYLFYFNIFLFSSHIFFILTFLFFLLTSFYKDLLGVAVVSPFHLLCTDYWTKTLLRAITWKWLILIRILLEEEWMFLFQVRYLHKSRWHSLDRRLVKILKEKIFE